MSTTVENTSVADRKHRKEHIKKPEAFVSIIYKDRQHVFHSQSRTQHGSDENRDDLHRWYNKTPHRSVTQSDTAVPIRYALTNYLDEGTTPRLADYSLLTVEL